MESYGNNQQPDDRFVAIDVEYADTKEQHICQVGLAVVCNTSRTITTANVLLSLMRSL